jgi:predicted phage tail protein
MMQADSQRGGVHVVAATHPFSQAVARLDLPQGGTVLDMLAAAGVTEDTLPMMHVHLGGHPLPRELWARAKPKPGTVLTVRAVPLGGGGGGGKKNTMRVVLQIAVLAAAAVIGAAAGGWVASTVFSSTSKLAVAAGTALVSSSVSLVGGLIVNAIAPPPSVNLSSSSGVAESPSLSIAGARNSANPFGVVPRVLGKIALTPPLAAQTYTELAGDDQYLRMLVCWGYGPLQIEDIRIGETPIEEYDDVEMEIRQGFDDDAPITLYTTQPREEPLSILLTAADGWTSRTTEADTDEISLDIVFAQGLAIYNDAGGKDPATVELSVEYRTTGSDSWIVQQETWSHTAAQSAALRVNVRWPVPRGQYDVRIKRLTADTTNDRRFDQVSWSVLRSIKNEMPVRASGLALTALRIRATDQLYGVVDQIRATVTSIAPDWDSGTESWIERPTANPASLYRLVCLDRHANARAKAESALVLADLQAWHTWCATKNFTVGHVVDYDTSVAAVRRMISACGRASPTRVDLRWSVVVDQPRDIEAPTPIFTPRNSWGYTFERVMTELPHAWRVRFLSAEADYQQDEQIVYVDGYTVDTASRFEGLDLVGPTDPEVVARDTLYHHATLKYRSETHSFSAAEDATVCQRGDLIRLNHDVILAGLGYGRVADFTVVGSTVSTITIDQPVTMEADKNYAVRVRLANGNNLVVPITTVAGTTSTVGLAGSVPLSAGIAVDNLVTFGEAGNETIPLIVRSIRPGPDCTYQLSCVDAAPAVWAADSGAIPAYSPSVSLPLELRPIMAPSNVQATATAVVRGDGTTLPALTISWHAAADTRVTGYAVAWRVVGETAWSGAAVAASDSSHTILALSTSAAMAVRVRAVAGERTSAWTDVSIVNLVGDTVAPAAPSALAAEGLVDGFRVLVTPATDVDIAATEVQQAPTVEGTWSAFAFGAATSFSRAGYGAAVRRYFRARHIDRTGNIGPWSPLAGALSQAVSTALLAEQIIGPSQLRDDLAIGIDAAAILAGAVAELAAETDRLADITGALGITTTKTPVDPVTGVPLSTDDNGAFVWRQTKFAWGEDTRALIVEEQSARITAISAEVTARETLAVQINDDITAATEVSSAAVAAIDGKVEATVGLKVTTTAGGKRVVGGIGLRADESASEFLVVADKMAFVAPGDDPDDPGAVRPFLVAGTVDGVPNVVIPSTIIGDATITSAKIGDYIQSTNFVTGESGWKIDKTGTAEFQNVTVGGRLSSRTIKSFYAYCHIGVDVHTGYDTSSASGTFEVFVDMTQGIEANGIYVLVDFDPWTCFRTQYAAFSSGATQVVGSLEANTEDGWQVVAAWHGPITTPPTDRALYTRRPVARTPIWSTRGLSGPIVFGSSPGLRLRAKLTNSLPEPLDNSSDLVGFVENTQTITLPTAVTSITLARTVGESPGEWRYGWRGGAAARGILLQVQDAALPTTGWPFGEVIVG